MERPGVSEKGEVRMSGSSAREGLDSSAPEPVDGGPDDRVEDGPRLRKPAPGNSKDRSFWKEVPVLIVVALVLALVIKTYVAQAFYIPSGSMQNTLQINDRILINKLAYDWGHPSRGDIIVFDGAGSWDPAPPPGPSNLFSKLLRDVEELGGASVDGTIYVKRVIGLPGDRVACCNAQGKVTVNGVPLSEGSYLYPGDAPSKLPFNVTVPAGHLWVMGDDRHISSDSRLNMGQPGGGAILENKVLGKVFVIIWPPSRWSFLGVPATFHQPGLDNSHRP